VLSAKKIRKKESAKIIITVALVVTTGLGFFFIMQLALNTQTPFLILESNSMCISESGNCDGWNHPFDKTLHLGDLLIIQGINPADLNSNYPNSDIIVFKDQMSGNLIVHRIISEQKSNNTDYFKTKGDGTGPIVWPNIPNYFDDIPTSLGVPQDQVIGRVAIRIPWVGGIALFLKNNPWSIIVIIALILLLAVGKIVATSTKKKASSTTKKIKITVIDVFIKSAFDKLMFKGQVRKRRKMIAES